MAGLAATAIARDERMGSPPASLAPQMLSQPILPGWTFADTVNVTEENSASPETERQIVSRYSYGRQLGRVLDAVNGLIAERPDTAPEPPSIKTSDSSGLISMKLRRNQP